MTFVKRYDVSVTTNSTSGGSAYSPVTNGRLLHVIYATGTLATTADLTISTASETTGQTLLSYSNIGASKTVSPVGKIHAATSGAALATGGIPFHVSEERIKVAIAQGGANKTGTVTLIVG